MTTELSKGVVRRRYSLKLTPLTPTHVWSGRSALVGVDAVQRGGELCVVDIGKVSAGALRNVLSSTTDITEVVNELARRGLCFKEIALDEVTSIQPNSEVRLMSDELIPASTLKGYLRTAIMYSILSSMNRKELNQAFISGVNLSKKPKNVSQGLEGYVFRRPRRTRAKGFIDLMQKVVVRGPVSAEGREVALAEFLVYELTGRSATRKFTLLVEALRGGTLTYEVAMLENVHPSLVASGVDLVEDLIRKYDEVYGIDLLGALRDFGCRAVKEELNKVSEVAGLEHYRSRLNEWLSKYCGSGGDCTIARVGFMTGHESKTVLALLRDVNRGLYNQVVSYMSRQVGRVWDSRTLKLARTPNGLIGVGWCEVCVEKA